MKIFSSIRISCSIIFLLFATLVAAQVDQSLRVEFPVEDSYGHQAITLSDQKQALLIKKEKSRDRKIIQWSFDLVDDKFNSIQKTQFDFSTDLDFHLSQFYENHYYVFKYDVKKGEYVILDLNVTDLSKKIQEGILPRGLRLDELSILGDNLFLSAYTKKNHAIFVINLTTKVIKTILPKEMTELKITYTDMQRIDNIPSEKEMVFKYKACEKTGCDYMMIRFNSKGEQLGNFFFLPKADEERELTSISISKLATDQYLTTGTYSVSRSNKPNGIYLARINNEKIDFIKYYNFLDLNNFTSYLSKKQQDKIEKKKSKKEEAGEELNLSYYVTVHDITVKDEEYFFLGEFYYPTYRTESYTTMGANGSMVTHSRQVFDGYQYSHACVAGFDMTGKLTWSNTFEMFLSYKTFTVKQFIRMNHEEGNTKLVYANGLLIKTITFKKNEVLKDESSNIQMKTDEVDIIKRIYNTSIEWWYERNYINSGTQIIKNKENEAGNKKREVFYLLKISY